MHKTEAKIHPIEFIVLKIPADVCG